MKKATKLLLSILPISSISLLSLVSCYTNKPSSVNPTNRTQTTDKNKSEKKPNKNNDTSTNSTNYPNTNDTGEKPSVKPMEESENNHDNNSNSDDRSHSESSQTDEHKNDVDFLDLNTIKKELSFDNTWIYKNKDAKSAWFSIKNDLTTLTTVFYANNKSVKKEYKLSFENLNENPEFILDKGIISKVKIKFTKNGKSKIFEFILTGFKKVDNEKDINKKNDYIKPKKILDSKITGLYSSILAYMLLFIEDPNTYKSIEEVTNGAINFEELKNTGTNLFNNNFIGFSVGTKELLFDFNEDYRKLYTYKITDAGFDDINGKLNLKVEINNSEDNKNSEPSITKEFSFEGFRKINFKNPNDNPFSILLLQSDLKKILNDKKIKRNLTTLNIDINKEKELYDFGVGFGANGLWENEILNRLTINLTDNENRIYDSKETLTFKKSKENNYKFILGLKNGFSVYPFNTMITKNSIKNILLSIKNKKAILDFELEIPVFATSLSNLTSFSSYDSKILKLRISSTTSID
ncbi:LppA family lipoprotein [Mycoplasma capricolum]|uniref:LppA family lipoprotein n=1 Tax=Mycoplasma capricolum TaxID=2095 RepID=UPI003DA1E9A6